ncbi:hypothetical protein [Streptomyces zaomyceticus]|uniref:hypothetical protein n=1 Tax=Streptomyces zaomyceticus TaxID=68286 RepID=UPI00342904F7
MTSIHHPRLSGLGRNPAAPRDVLVRLAAHKAGRQGIQGRRGRLDDTVAEALLEHGGHEAAVRLSGDRISPAVRRRVAEHHDPAIRDARADFVRGMVGRDVPFGLDVLEEAYGRPRTALVEDPDPHVRAAVARTWTDRPLTAQTALLADPDPRVRAAATMPPHAGVPPEWTERCLADPAVRANVASYLPLTSDQFDRLLGDEDERVRQAVAENPSLSAEMVARLVDVEDPLVRVAAAMSRHVDAGTRDRLYALVEAGAAEGDSWADVALHWNTAEPDWLRRAPLDERMTYLDCPHPVFRRVLATCRDLPDAAWRRLDDDPEVSVRRAAAQRPDTPPEVLERLARAHGEAHHVRPLLVDHPRFPRHLLRTFVDEPEAHVRCMALEDPELPVAGLSRLAADTEAFVRRGAARHPRLTEALLEQLLSDPDPVVTDDAAANPVLRPARMERMLAEAGL